MSNIVKVRSNELGLAAFIKMNNEKLIKIEDRCFYFESDIDYGIWKTQYLNTDSYVHDTYVVELRNMLTSHYRGR